MWCRGCEGKVAQQGEAVSHDLKFAYYITKRVSSYILGTNSKMSPTIFRAAGFRFYFFSREEPRMHVHVQNQHGEAQFWLTPHIELAKITGLSQHEITEAYSLIMEHHNDIHNAWMQHFPR